MIDAENDQRILLTPIDAMNNHIGQARHADFSRALQRPLMPHVRICNEEIDHLSKARADADGCVGVTITDIVCNGLEMPTCSPREPQP